VKISQGFPLLLSNRIDIIMESFEKILSKKGAKEGLHGAELERSNEGFRGCIRAILAINGACDLKFNKKWETFFSRFSCEDK